MAVSGTYDGIVVDAAMNSLVIDTAEGMMYAVSLPETEDVVATSDGILLGQAVTVTCEDGVASSITDCAVKPAADREVLALQRISCLPVNTGISIPFPLWPDIPSLCESGR